MHYCTFVIIGAKGDPDALVAGALAPFDEALAVTPYREYRRFFLRTVCRPDRGQRFLIRPIIPPVLALDHEPGPPRCGPRHTPANSSRRSPRGWNDGLIGRRVIYRHLESDIVLTAPLGGPRRNPGKKLLIYVLIEHQSEPDRLMPLRLADSQVQIFRYQLRKWSQTHRSLSRARLLPVLPIVFYTGLRRWPQVGTLADLIERGEEFRAVTPIVERPLFLSLPEIPGAQLERDGGYFGCVLQLVQQRKSRAEEFEDLLGRAVAHLDRMSAAEHQRLGELLSYVRAMLYHERRESEQRKLQQVMEHSVQNAQTRQEVLEMGKTMADVLMERGRKEGQRKGERKAGLETRRQTLVRQLGRRFGDVPPEVVSAVESTADVDQLDTWLDRLVTASTLDELGIR